MSQVLRSAQVFAVVVMVSGLSGLCLEPTALSSTGVDRFDENPGEQAVASGLPARALLRIGTDNLRTGVIPGEIVFSPDGKIVASPVAWRGGLPEVLLFGIRDGRPFKRLRAPDRPPGFVQCLAFSPDGSKLLWGESTGYVALWDITGDRILFRAKLHRGEVEAVVLSADVKLMASGGADGAVHVRQVDSPEKDLRDLEVGEQRTAPAPVDPSGVRCLAFTPDGTRLIAGAGLSGSIFVWRIADGQLVLRIEGPAEQPNPANHLLNNRSRLERVVVMPDGQRLVSTGQRLARNPKVFDPRTRQMWVTDVRFWNLETGQCLATLDGGEEPFKGQAAVRRDGKLVILTDPYRLRIIDPSRGSTVRTIDLPGRLPWGTAFSPSGNLVATYLEGGIVLFDVPTGLRLHVDGRTPAGGLLSAAWSSSGDQIITGHGDGEVRLWDARTGNLHWHRLLAPILKPWGQAATPAVLTFSHDGKRIIVGGTRDQSGVAEPDVVPLPGILSVYETDGNLVMSEFYPRHISRAALSSDSKIIVVGPPDPGFGPSPNAALLRGIDVATGATLWTSLPGERPADLGPLAQRDVTAMCMQPASRGLEVALVTGEVVQLDALTGRERHRFLADWRTPEARQHQESTWPSMWKAAFSRDGRTLASATDEFIYVWDVNTAKLRRSIRLPHRHGCNLALSSDGKTLATSDIRPYQGNWGDDTIRLYDTTTGEQVLTLEPDDDRATVLTFSPDGSKLFTGFERAAALVWGVRRNTGDPATNK